MKQKVLFGKEEIRYFKDEYEFLSNFYPCRIEFEGIIFSSVEHAYVASKTKDLDRRKAISKIERPGTAKRIGREIELREDWLDVRLGIMEELIRKKFSIPELKEKLLETGDAMLFEGNWWGDKFWGVDSISWKGENHLGLIIMNVRKEIK